MYSYSVGNLSEPSLILDLLALECVLRAPQARRCPDLPLRF